MGIYVNNNPKHLTALDILRAENRSLNQTLFLHLISTSQAACENKELHGHFFCKYHIKQVVEIQQSLSAEKLGLNAGLICFR